MRSGDIQAGESPYRWYILFLATLTAVLTIAAPSLCLPALFQEISEELNLSLVELGWIWSIGALPGIVMVLMVGAIGDRFGPKRVLTLACFFAGMAGLLRGLSSDFLSLAATVILFGIVTPGISMNLFKVCSIWFPPRQMALASGVISMGMALGFMLGSRISAVVLSPWLGGWRNVLVFYGVIAITFAIPWLFTRVAPVAVSAGKTSALSLRQALIHVAGIKRMWLLGLAILGISGCIQGTLGYLPLYLRGLGWSPVDADGLASNFHLASMIFVIPIALGAGRLGSRRKVLLAAASMIILGVGLLAVVEESFIGVAVIMAGWVRDGFMAIFLTTILETEGVGPAYAGTATGFVMLFSGVGNLLAPPMGNSLAATMPGLPFIFWAALALVGCIGLYMAKDPRTEGVLVARPTEQRV